jgi:hypothetical protein
MYLWMEALLHLVRYKGLLIRYEEIPNEEGHVKITSVLFCNGLWLETTIPARAKQHNLVSATHRRLSISSWHH